MKAVQLIRKNNFFRNYATDFHYNIITLSALHAQTLVPLQFERRTGAESVPIP
jgi:hypothetical protein